MIHKFKKCSLSSKNKLIHIVLFLSFLLYPTLSNAQVTIGSGESPEEGALLDLKQDVTASNFPVGVTATKGILLPRVYLEKASSLQPLVKETDPDYINLKKSHKGVIVYNVNTNPDDISGLGKNGGIYQWNGEKWMRLLTPRPNNAISGSVSKFISLPIFELQTAPLGTYTKNLYAIYSNNIGASSPPRNPAATNIKIEDPLKSSRKLYYYVTDYDKDTFANISIDIDGLMTYSVIAAPTSRTYINLVILYK